MFDDTFFKWFESFDDDQPPMTDGPEANAWAPVWDAAKRPASRTCAQTSYFGARPSDAAADAEFPYYGC